MIHANWSKERLEDIAATSFTGRKVIVVSCRAPFIHERRNGQIVCVSPAGGLTTALKPTMAAVGGTWIAQATGSADRDTASPRGRLDVPPECPSFTLRRLWIDPKLRQGHYEGLSNQALWPLCHNVYQRPVFRESDWVAYRRVNEIFAQAVLEEAQGEPAVVFIQDYHFALLPQLLKSANPTLTVGQFWHIPFPNCEILQTFPWSDELLEGMLGNDLMAFHLPRHCRNFMEAVDASRHGRVERLKETIWRSEHRTFVRAAPISIDFHGHAVEAAGSAVDGAMQVWRQRIGTAQFVGLGIDRMDYTKGIPERIRALGSLFTRNPELRGLLTFVQVGVPSRGSIAEYAQLEREIDGEVLKLNQRWATDKWHPVIFEKRNLPPFEMMALHRLARFCMVTPLHDGMNLVAKEFLASRFDEDGVLILSRFAGAAQELSTALLVNPFSERELCDATMTALRMPRRERQSRMAAARDVVAQNNVYTWAGELLQELASIATTHSSSRAIGFSRLSASVA